MASGLDAEALAFEQAMLHSLELMAEAAERLVKAQEHLVRARGFESKAAKILIRKAIYAEEVCRLQARSKLFKERADEHEKRLETEDMGSHKKQVASRHMRSRTLMKQAKMRERKMSIIEERARKLMEQAEAQKKMRAEEEEEARRLQGEAINVQREY